MAKKNPPLLTAAQVAARTATTNTERKTTVENALRWTANILAEMVGNYNKHMPENVRVPLKQALSLLHEALQNLRAL